MPAGAINGIFLMNHDEVTSRPMTEYKGNIGKVKIATTLGLLCSGMPFVYNGNELGMEDAPLKGDMRFRTPIEWDRLPAMQSDKKSLFNFHKTLLALRNEFVPLRRGLYKNIVTDEKHTLAFLRYTDSQTMMVVINLDKEPHSSVHLNLNTDEVPAGNVTYLLGGIAGDKKIDETNKATFLVDELAPYEIRVILCEGSK
jgi:alpha-glucosidase